MRAASGAVAVLLLLAACGGTPGSRHRTYRSGSRLRAELFVAPGGASWFRGFWDSSLLASCYVNLAADGQRRCLPLAGAQARGYSDQACTQPLFVVDDTGSAGTQRTVSPSFGFTYETA